MKSQLDLIADKAKQNVNMKFTSLIHHINEENLLQCYSELKRNKACGIDGVTLEKYGNDLNKNIKLLVEKLKTKKYRHRPVRRVYIPKPEKSEKRGLGIPTLEDKLVQLMAKKILEPIFESQFLECSYGFRPNLSYHTAILGFTHYLGITRKGWFSIKHKTDKQNLQNKLSSIKEWLKQIRNMLPLKEWWLVLKAKLLGHYRYYGVSGNYHSINQFYRQVVRMVFKWINKRSQKKSMNWQQYLQYLSWNPLPKPKIYYQVY